MEVIGWIGSTLLALCGIPQAWQAYRQGHSRGISDLFLLMWFTGEVLTLIYVISSLNSPALLFNYVCNLLCLLVIIRYRIFPVK